jgi:hypothetical protein
MSTPPSSPPDLNRTQRWLQSVLMHPGGIEAGIESAEARRLFDIDAADAERVVTRSRRLTAAERLAIYHHAYFARLLECLRDEFPVFRHAVGEDGFDEFALGYLEQYPSRSYTLGRLAEQFPRYLAETRPPDEGTADSSPGWSDFLIDLATYELTVSEVFDGPGTEADAPLDAGRLAQVPAELWPDARLTPAPCLRLLTLRFPVHRYYATVRQQRDEPPPAPAPTHLAVSRRDYVVRHHELAPAELAILEGLMAGQPVGQAIARALDTAGDDPDELAGRVEGWFRRWTAEGFFRAVVPPGA